MGGFGGADYQLEMATADKNLLETVKKEIEKFAVGQSFNIISVFSCCVTCGSEACDQTFPKPDKDYAIKGKFTPGETVAPTDDRFTKYKNDSVIAATALLNYYDKIKYDGMRHHLQEKVNNYNQVKITFTKKSDPDLTELSDDRYVSLQQRVKNGFTLRNWTPRLIMFLLKYYDLTLPFNFSKDGTNWDPDESYTIRHILGFIKKIVMFADLNHDQIDGIYNNAPGNQGKDSAGELNEQLIKAMEKNGKNFECIANMHGTLFYNNLELANLGPR